MPARPGTTEPPAASDATANGSPGEIRRRDLARMRAGQRRRRMVMLIALLITAGLVGADLVIEAGGRRARSSSAGIAATATATAGKPSPGTVNVSPSGGVPQTGPGTYGYATGTGPVIGSAGTVTTFRVAVETGAGVDPAEFAATIEATLADPRGWTAGANLRFQRVTQSAGASFTIFLATAGSTDKVCAAGGLHTDGYLSCARPGQILINLTRWLTATPDYGAPRAAYQQFLINHEIGRELGHGNEACPAPGVLAPVMQQQTLGLKGCRPNSWPYVGTARYSGPTLP